MKRMKRILSAFLVCALVLPMATTYVNADANDSNSTENVVWFTEDFKGTTDDIGVNGTGWNNLGNFTLDTTNEVLKSKTSGQYIFLNQQQAMSWSNYTVEADVVVTDEVIGSYTATGRWGGIVAAVSDCSRTGSNKGSGYEFMICYNKDGSTYCALKDRNGTSSGSANVDYAFNLNTPYNLKMELKGNKITCYINDQPVISNHQINIIGSLTGSVGFHSAGQYCTFDNLKVYTPGLIFNEEFVGTTDDVGVNGTGWNNLGNFTLDTTAGNLKSKTSGQYSFLNRQEALAWTDYMVEADVVVTDEVIGSYTATGRWGGIVAAVTDCSRTGSNKGSGYEFMICYNKDGSTYCALKDRNGTSSGSANVDYTFNLNTPYNLKMELKGNKITCYINDQPVISNHQINITGDLTGSIGVHSAGQYCTFDNIRVWENQPEVEEAPGEISFVEEFKGTTDDIGVNGTGWNNLGNFTLDTEAQKLKSKTSGQYSFLNRQEAMSWSNYSVKADVVVTDEVIDGYSATGRWGGIVAAVTDPSRTGGNAGSGYEFMICYNKDGSTYCALKDRSGTNSGSSNVPYEFELNKAYTLKMELNGNKITCYINDEPVIEDHVINIQGDLTGTIGVHSAGQYCTFDNIHVWENTNLNDDEDNKDEDNKEDLEDGLWFKETFSGSNQDLVSAGWDQGRTANLTADKQLQLSAQANSSMYLTGHDKASDWSNYTVEADVIITDTEIAGNTAKNRVAGLIAAANSKNKGYELMIGYIPAKDIYFYQLKDRITGTDLTAEITYPFKLNEVVNLKMVLDGNTIECYIDGELEIICEVEGAKDLKGTIGVHGVGNVTQFDNILVYESKPSYKLPPLTDVTGSEVWFEDGFSSTDSLMTERGWSKEYQIHDGRVCMPNSTENTAYVTGIENADLWKDYTAEAEVYVADDPTVIPTILNPAAFLCVRSTSEKSGYDFGIIWNNGEDIGWVRLRDRTTSTTLAENKNIKIEKDKTYQLKMTVKGNQIDCYLDGELVMSAVDAKNSNPTGTVGIRKNGYLTYFDKVAVYKTNRYQSPQTGDMSYIYLYVLVLCASATLYGTTVYRRKNKQNV